MEVQFPDFVGRTSHLASIAQQAAKTGKTVVVNIVGDGGVGKTTLLQQVEKTYCSRPDILVSRVIDFSQTVHRVQSWVLKQIVDIQPTGFQTFQQKLAEIETAEPWVRQYWEREAFDAFVTDYNRLARDYRIILLFDTVEYVQDTPLLDFIVKLTANKLNNTLLILAGRRNNTDDFMRRLADNFKDKDSIVSLSLLGFTKSEAKSYIDEARIPALTRIDEALQENIYLLSDGNPIKIALALDWLNRGIPLMPEVTRLKPSEIKPDDIERRPVAEQKELAEQLATLKIRFEEALMSGIRQLETPIDEVILYMAHLHRRFNLSMIEYFFPEYVATEKDKAKLITELKNLPFVKYLSDDYFVLHDEMSRLVQKYVWDVVEDPDKTLRVDLSREAAEYYGKYELKLDKGTENQRLKFWSRRVEQMYYRLYANFREGYSDFEQLFEELVQERRAELAALAVSFLKEFESEPEFSELLRCFVDGYYDSGVLIAQHRFEEALSIQIVGRQNIEQQIASLDPDQAGSLDKHLSKRLYLVYHQLGFCYRSLGDWKRAIQNYENSLTLTLESVQEVSRISIAADDRVKRIMAQIAENLNNLANVHRFVGNFHEARLLCQNSILLRQVWKPNEVASSQYVMAMILWEMGGTSEAMRYLRAAERSQQPEDEITQARINKYRGYILFRAGLPHLAVSPLQEAAFVFRRRGQLSELAETLILQSRIYRESPGKLEDRPDDQNNMQAAEQLVDEAHDFATKIGDEFRQAEAHLTRALHYYHWSRLDPVRRQAYRQKALAAHREGLKLVEGRHYRLLSFFNGLRGDIAFDDNDYALAFEQYAQRCALATHYKRAVYERAIDTVGDRLRDLEAKDTGLAKRYADDVLQFWSREQLGDRYPELIDEIDEIKRAIADREKLEALSQQYQRALRQGEWSEAIACCDRILEIPSLYTDVNQATVILDKIRALHRYGDLEQARRLAKVTLQIGVDLEMPELIGNTHLWLAKIFWDATNTAEAAAHLAQAEAVFRQIGDEIGLIRVRRQHSYILHRTGFFQQPLDELAECVQVFKDKGLDSELADVWNVMSRILRTDPETPNYDQAREYATWALQRAQAANDSYAIAECYLSLAILAYREQNYEQVLEICETGLAHLSEETHLLHSVYHGMQGGALFEMGLSTTPEARAEFWDKAFEAFILELVEAIKSKPIRLVRALDLIYGTLVRLPLDDMQKYTQQIKDAWRQHHLEEAVPIVIRMCEEAIRYRPYIQTKSN